MSNIEHWKTVIAEYQSSDLTQKVFCQQRNIKIHTLHYWLKKLRESETPGTAFIPFKALESKSESCIQIGHARLTLDSSEIPSLLLELDRVGLLYDPT